MLPFARMAHGVPCPVRALTRLLLVTSPTVAASRILQRRLNMTRILALVAAFFLAGPALAHGLTVGDLEIIHPHIPQPAASAKAAGGFMAITNNGTEPERLIGIETGIAMKSDVHESKVDANGLGTMTAVDAVEIAPGATVNLEHGGYHIMFMGLTGPLTEGEMHKATLIFERAGRVEIEFMIDPPTSAGQGAMDHSKMDHGAEGTEAAAP
jgi:periplasmic copper chaperone A